MEKTEKQLNKEKILAQKKKKREEQELRTELNLLKKTLRMVLWETEHVNKDPYDYGEASDSALETIKGIIRPIGNLL